MHMLFKHCNNPVGSCRNRIKDKNLGASMYLRGDCKNTGREVEKRGRERKSEKVHYHKQLAPWGTGSQHD